MDAAAQRTTLEVIELKAELDRRSETPQWVWTLFIVAILPNIMNGFHLNSYVFVGKMPDQYWCDVPVLQQNGWSADRIRELSAVPDRKDSCSIRDLDYATLAQDNNSNATTGDSVEHAPQNGTRSCLRSLDTEMKYNITGSSIVTDWNLLCENSVWRTSAQTSVSMGKAIGSIGTGILSDKYGRRALYVGGACLYLLTSIMMMATPWYWVFLGGRLLMGVANSMIFYPSAVLLAENIGIKNRFWTSMAMHYAYPIGMLYLAGAAYFLDSWRALQLALTIPAAYLIVNIIFFRESPRWLISKGRLSEAHREIYGKNAKPFVEPISPVIHGNETPTPAAPAKRGMFREMIVLYGRPKQRRVILICHFVYLTASFSYYVSVINADNLAANKIVYVVFLAAMDSLSYTVNILLLRNVGRRWNISISFGIACICYLSLLVISKEQSSLQLTLAMIARLCVCSAYSVISLYAAELFPTEVRSSALGACSTLAHFGSMSAPFVVDFLGRLAWFIPTTICAAMLFLAGVLVFLSPETSNSALQDFVDEEPNVPLPAESKTETSRF